MNPEKYAEKAIDISQVRFDIPIEQAASIALRFGYPEPKYGVVLYSAQRGDANGGIDWGVNKLRLGITELIRSVAKDCIEIVKQSNEIDEAAKLKLEQAIQLHFELTAP